MSVHFPYLLALFTIISVRGGRVLLALFAIRLEAPDFLVGLLAGTFSLAPMLMAYQIGKLSDRYGTRWPLTVGIVGSMAGILVPLTLQKFRIDPAVSSAVFVTMATDVMGFFTFLGLATLVLLR